MNKIIATIENYIFLQNLKSTLEENDLLAKYRLTLYQTSTFIFLLIYISFILLYNTTSPELKYFYYLLHFLFLSTFLNYILLNIHKNKNIAYGFCAFLYFVVLHVATYKSGGIQNSGNAYLLCIILYTFMIGGKKMGIICTLATIVNLIYFYFLTEYTTLIDNGIYNSNPNLIKLDYLVTFIFSVLIIWSQSYYLQKTHDSIVKNIVQTNKELLHNEKEKVLLSRLVAENELKALRAQMNPHFTFNVMNSIQYYLSNNQTDVAQNYLTKFSTLIRKVLDNSKKSVVLLKDEIETLTIYMELEQMRFKNKFEYILTIKEDIITDEWYIPSMVIQPIVENCIKHGFVSNDCNGTIDLSFIKNSATSFQCIITDNGIGRIKAADLKKNNILTTSHNSYGVQITEERIKVFNKLHNTAAAIQIIDINENNKTGTSVIITFPIMEY